MPTRPSPLELRLLGTGGWLPGDSRETSCHAIRADGALLVLDAGTGLRRIITGGAALAGVERMDIALSHFHLDHTVGLSYLDAVRPGIKRYVWGPGRELYGEETSKILDRMLGHPFSSAAKERMFDAVLDMSLHQREIGPHAVRVRAQTRHSAPSLAFRYGDAVAYCTDTAFDPETAGFARGVGVLLHEAWVTGEAGTRFHSSAAEAARLARDADVGRLVLVHLDPRVDARRLLTEARAIFPDTQLGVDGQVYRLQSLGR